MKMALFFVKWHDTFEIFISLGTLGFTIHQFIKTKKLKKIEKKLLLYSKFFYLESLLSTNLEKLKKILENGNQLSELSLQELAASYKLDTSVLDVVSEISELSYGCFDSMNIETARRVENFLGCASETYHMLNGFYGIVEKGSIAGLEEYTEEIWILASIMRNCFYNYRVEMYKHCVVKEKHYKLFYN
ncbi:MAG: hypothetical protein HFG82_13110 [Dorea sp.]|jgi:hypothetical protein|nr:hypothetical protein [Dorea sp.]